MQREDAWALVNEYTTVPHLIRHMLAVEAAMRAYAERFGEDVDLWGLAGLMHDFDYEQNPDVSVEGHPIVGSRILKELGYPDEVVSAMLSHAAEITGVQPESLLEKTLLAVDEMTGFLVAVALVRPSKSILDVELKSVRKKWKTKEFAAPVNRAEVEHAANEIGMSLDDHILVVLNAMKGCAAELGLERQEAA
ncbi:MAG TPA: HDIG domain-containing protein [Nitrolancea sp.]|jgi:putative nucleotidyltransferase with HDIG domain|nr:HDIG domain-containing protein [Nitrolancea sp.]